MPPCFPQVVCFRAALVLQASAKLPCSDQLTLDLWLDDVSMAFLGDGAAQVTHKALTTFRTLKEQLSGRQLPANSTKTKIVPSDNCMESSCASNSWKEIRTSRILRETLGESSAVRMQRISTFEARLSKARGRLGRLHRLNLT